MQDKTFLAHRIWAVMAARALNRRILIEIFGPASYNHYVLFEVIAEAGRSNQPMTIREISKTASVSLSTAKSIVKDLLEWELISRKPVAGTTGYTYETDARVIANALNSWEETDWDRVRELEADLMSNMSMMFDSILQEWDEIRSLSTPEVEDTSDKARPKAD